MGLRPLAAVLLVVVLGVGTSSALAAHRPTASRGTNTIVSQGTGRQVLEGTGLTYGSLLPTGVVRVVDLSSKHDAKITVSAQVPTSGGTTARTITIRPVRFPGGALVFKIVRPVKLAAKASLAFSVAGSKFRLVLDGTSVLNGAAVVGKVTLEGTGTIAVNGATPASDWLTAGRITLTSHVAAPAKPASTVTTISPTTTS